MASRFFSSLFAGLLVALLLLASACQKEECEKGAKLRENLGQLEFSLRGVLSQPESLRELCAWIRESESPFLRLNGLELFTVAQKTGSPSVREAARDLSAALVGDFGVAHNIDSMCGAFFEKGYTTDTQFYIRDTINQLRNPVSRGAVRTLMASGGCAR